MYRHSLRTRVAIAFATCVAVLSIIWGFAFFAAIKLSEDRVLTRQLEHAVEIFPSSPVAPRRYERLSDLPTSLKPWAQTYPEFGIYEFEEQELHVAIIPADNEQQRAFMVFDVAGIEAASSEDWWWLLIITGVVGTLGVLGFGLGMLVMRRAVAPVSELAKLVADIDPERLSADDHKRVDARRFGDDEVGVLATTIEKTLGRISAFVERERYFTSSASHELRTPITVIMGALEILHQNNLSAADERTLERVKRATLDMKRTIEMFLCLAREKDDRLFEEQFLITPLVHEAVEQQRYLQQRQSAEVKLDIVANPQIQGHPQAFSIIINNLVKNAFEHALDERHPITIRVTENTIVVSNHVSNGPHRSNSKVDSLSQGYGLGLGIVGRLCERNGWSFSLQTDKDHVVASITW